MSEGEGLGHHYCTLTHCAAMLHPLQQQGFFRSDMSFVVEQNIVMWLML